jgi:hypothetical protein
MTYKKLAESLREQAAVAKTKASNTIIHNHGGKWNSTTRETYTAIEIKSQKRKNPEQLAFFKFVTFFFLFFSIRAQFKFAP